MTKSKVYTRSGDKGETSLVNGTRALKSDERIDLYGEVDELNSWIGVILSHSEEFEGLESTRNLLISIQSTLFDIGSRLACEEEFWDKFKLPKVDPTLTGRLEAAIDDMDSSLEPLKSFVLPGGSKAASFIHIARTRCRKVERLLVSFEQRGNKLPANGIELINRLSDFLFVFARKVNKLEGVKEPKWIPKKSDS